MAAIIGTCNKVQKRMECKECDYPLSEALHVDDKSEHFPVFPTIDAHPISREMPTSNARFATLVGITAIIAIGITVVVAFINHF